MFESVKAWLGARRRRPFDELLAVEFDDAIVRVRALDGYDPAWNQECRWPEIVRVCFRDGGPNQTDIIYLDLHHRSEPVEIPTEARGGDAFFGELEVRGLFPQPIRGEAIRSSDGGLYCWPPEDALSKREDR